MPVPILIRFSVKTLREGAFENIVRKAEEENIVVTSLFSQFFLTFQDIFHVYSFS